VGKQDKWITARDAAAKLGFSINYVYSSLWSGKLPGKKIDGKWMVSLQAVEDRLDRMAAARG